ncbi:helix-turn-helix domain-containing protein [Streptomyces sp. NPDC059875]|uniref:helix-turn-helix domain-containing protein n=1 Tax=unclassified Streptomyces TaxID=2593676 RepID=UPI0036657E43
MRHISVHSSPVAYKGLALWARIVQACAEGRPNLVVAARLGVDRGTVAKRRTRFLRDGAGARAYESRPGGAGEATGTVSLGVGPQGPRGSHSRPVVRPCLLCR